MTIQVAGDLYDELYLSIDGKMFEIKRQLRQQGSYPFDMRALDRHLQAAIEGRFVGAERFNFENYELVRFHKDDEQVVDTKTVFARAYEAGATTGERDVNEFLVNQDKLPAEWREFSLVFPGVRSVHDRGRILPRVIYRLGHVWREDKVVDGYVWHRFARLVRFRAGSR